MQRLGVRGAVRPIYGSLGVKRLITVQQTHELVPTQQQERMVVDPVNQYQKL